MKASTTPGADQIVSLIFMLECQARPPDRLTTPEEIVGVFLLLASDEDRYITASQFTVDGGITAQ